MLTMLHRIGELVRGAITARGSTLVAFVMTIAITTTTAVAVTRRPHSPTLAAHGTSVVPGKNVRPDPFAAMTDIQRQAEIDSFRAQGARRRAEFDAKLNLAKIDLAKLPRAMGAADYPAPPADIRSAVAQADIIVLGTVKHITSEGLAGIDSAVAIERTVKGSPRTSLIIRQPSIFQEAADGTGIEVVEEPGSPFLVPGEHVLLMLKTYSGTTTLIAPLPAVGTYFVRLDGTVEPYGTNPFGGSVLGLPVDDAIRQIVAATS